MMPLVPTITRKALAAIHVVAQGTCGTDPFFFILIDYLNIDNGVLYQRHQEHLSSGQL